MHMSEKMSFVNRYMKYPLCGLPTRAHVICEKMAAEKNQFTGNELPSLLPKQKSLGKAKVKEGHYGAVCDTLRQGFSSVRNDLTYSHPIECSERNYVKVQDQRDMMMLRSIQGLQAPLKLQLERSLAAQIQRLPCLPSSMVALETLLGFDTTIDFDDFLNDPNDSEVARDAHSVMEN